MMNFNADFQKSINLNVDFLKSINLNLKIKKKSLSNLARYDFAGPNYAILRPGNTAPFEEMLQR